MKHSDHTMTGATASGHSPTALRQIRASAGSGKTYTLTTSFLECLSTATNRPSAGCFITGKNSHAWSEILAVTFTNRAASEMQERIILRLKKAALGQLCSDDPLLLGNTPWTQKQAQYWVQIILQRFGQLNVRTIDSLVHQLVRMSALDLHLPPDFTPEFVSKDALTPLLDTLLEDSRKHAGFAALLEQACKQQLHYNRTFRGFMSGTAIRNTILETVPILFSLSEQQHANLADAEQINKHLETLVRTLQNAAIKLCETFTAENLKVHANVIKLVDKCRAITTFDAAPKSVYLTKENLAACLNKTSPPASSDAEQRYVALCTAAQNLYRYKPLLQSALKIMPFFKLAQVMALSLPAYFRSEGRIPADLLYPMAHELLTAHKGVSQAFCRMGTNITHILIDEFQDTSQPQWDVLQPLAHEALSCGGSLTWVGDIKQAIYGWRGGNAALFDAVLQDTALLSMAPKPIQDTLPTNWRSRSEVVRHNNKIFSKLADKNVAQDVLQALLPKDIPQNLLEHTAKEVQQTFHACAQTVGHAKGGCVRFVHVEGANTDDLNDNVCSHLLDLLQELAPHRPWGDIAILVRSNNQASLAASWIMEQGIPVVTENSFLLGEHPIIQQLLALLTFMDSPEDDIALWTVLMSDLFAPLVGQDQQALQDWLASLPAKRTECLYELVQQHFPSLWSSFLLPLLHNTALLTPYAVVHEMLRLSHAEARFAHDHVFLQRFLEVLHQAEQHDMGTIASFVRHIKQRGLTEKAPMPEALDAVRILTIHKSKGLQFPVVIVPWHSARIRANSTPQVIEFEESLLLATAGSTEEAHGQWVQQACEALHLLYVAWTRPEDELYAFITKTPKSMAMASALERLLSEEEFTNNRFQHGTPIKKDTQKQLSAFTDTRILDGPINAMPAKNDAKPAAFSPMAWLPKLRIHRAPLERLHASPKRRGSFVHHCLEALRYTGNPQKDAEQAILQALQTFPILLHAPEMVTEDVTANLAWYAGLPEAPLWIQYGVPEQTLIDSQGNLVRADRVVKLPHSIVVLEFKTGSAHPKHQSQLETYAKLLQKAQPLPVLAVLIYIDEQRLEPLDIRL